jgi:hypothetical protein
MITSQTMEKVVYLLGAGFSAPLGLPVMSNFLIKSKDAFAQDPGKYAHFSKVFDTINAMHACKSYFEADLFNIEEILSILEMQEGLEKSPAARSFTQYIKDVIQHYTPRPPSPDQMPNETDTNNRVGAWQHCMFGEVDWSPYGSFVASLFCLQAKPSWIGQTDPGRIQFVPIERPSFDYSVVTLNYDSVLEDVCSFINKHHPSARKVQFQRDPQWAGDENVIHIPLAKLHGSVGTESIIAPTWNKHLYPQIVSDWRMAHDLISQANHLRILGYSLPTTDAYIKYLLKSAVSKCQNLKSIDVVCKGSTAKKHYDDFITFNFYRFKDVDIAKYLFEIHEASLGMKYYGSDRPFDKIEFVHKDFMNRP